MRVLRVISSSSIFLLALLFFASSTSVTYAQELSCTPVAQGNGSQVCTVHFHNDVTTFHIGPPPSCLLSGTITQTFNGVFHITITKDGDEAWDTSTMTGPFVLVPDDPSIPTYTGHATAWFGDSFNSQNQVSHFTINAHATAPNAPAFDFHETFHFSTSASGTNPPLIFDNATC